MTYEEFKAVYYKLEEKGFIKSIKVMWDNDIYTMLNEINKKYKEKK